MEGRSNVFLSATLDSGAASIAVRIRNISTRGALIEGAMLPSVGAEVRLLRGSLCAAGQITWQGHGNGGVNFNRHIDVGKWVQRVGHSGQHRIDEVVDAFRRTKVIPASLQDASSTDTLGELCDALEDICERLAGERHLSGGFAEDLLRLDSIAQALRRIAVSAR